MKRVNRDEIAQIINWDADMVIHPDSAITGHTVADKIFKLFEESKKPYTIPVQTGELISLLHSYRCQHTVDEQGDGHQLIDILTPPGDSDVGRGQREVELLADYLADAVSRKLR